MPMHGIQVMFDICLEMLPMQNQEDHVFITKASSSELS